MNPVTDAPLDTLRAWFPGWVISEGPDGQLTAESEGREPKTAQSPEELRVLLLDESWRGLAGKAGSL